MIVKDNDAIARLNSPMNLINRLSSLRSSNNTRESAMSLFGVGRQTKINERSELEEVKVAFNPFLASPKDEALASPEEPSQAESETSLDSILENHESQIKLGLAHDNAIALLNSSLSALSAKLDDVRADKLSAVISAASKTVESIRRERAESAKRGAERDVHFHFYTPEQKKISDYEVIEVTDVAQ